MTRSLHCQLLHEAAELLGGRTRLGRELQVPAQNLARWMAGIEPLPRPVFLKAVDLIIELTRESAAAVGMPVSCGGDVRRKDQHLKGGERDAR